MVKFFLLKKFYVNVHKFYSILKGKIDDYFIHNIFKFTQFKMIVLTNENTTSGNTKGIESIPQISKSLSDSSYNLKKIRHSLKDLCFHPPSAQILANLIELFKKEMKSQTDCFILLCHNIITHSPYANSIPQTSDFILFLSKIITDFSKKPQKSLDQIFRVFFFLCLNSPSHHSLLFDTISKILTMNLDFLNKKKKKSIIIGSSHKSPYPDLISQCLIYLNEMPDFNNNAVLLLSKEDVITGLINIFKNFHEESKYIFTFLGRLSSQIKNKKIQFKIPQLILDNIVPGDDFINDPFVAEYMIYNPDKFKSQIISVLEKPSQKSEIDMKIASQEKKIANPNGELNQQENDQTTISSVNLMQLRIVETEENIPELILDSIKSQIESNSSALLPLLFALQKLPRGAISDPQLVSSLYKRVQTSNLSVAFATFMCLCFVSDEIDWLCTFFIDTMSKLTYSARCSISLVLMKSWICALDHPESNKFFVIEIFEKMIMQFGNCIDQTMFNELLKKVIAADCADDFMNIFINSLDKLPSIESVIYIFFGAATLKKHADKQTFQEFLDVAHGYIDNAGPAMLSFYKITIDKINE